MLESHPLSAATVAMLAGAGLDAAAVGRLIAVALDEDLADGVDVTSVGDHPARPRQHGHVRCPCRTV